MVVAGSSSSYFAGSLVAAVAAADSFHIPKTRMGEGSNLDSLAVRVAGSLTDPIRRIAEQEASRSCLERVGEVGSYLVSHKEDLGLVAVEADIVDGKIAGQGLGHSSRLVTWQT